MEALTELCDLIAQNPIAFSDKLAWLCSGCPSPGLHHLSIAQIHALLATARFLSKSQKWFERSVDDNIEADPQNTVLTFISSINFTASFFPSSVSIEFISSFFSDMLHYISDAADLSSDFSAAAGLVIGKKLTSALQNSNSKGKSPDISKAFICAVSCHCPPLPSEHVDLLVEHLLNEFSSSCDPIPISPRELASPSSSASGISMLKCNGESSPKSEIEEDSVSTDARTTSSLKSKEKDLNNGVVMNHRPKKPANQNDSLTGRISVDKLGSQFGCSNGVALSQKNAATHGEETVETLEQQEIAFKLLSHMLEKSHMKADHIEQIRVVAAQQLKSLPAILKGSKSDWAELVAPLVTRVTAMLVTCQAATMVLVNCLHFWDSDGKSSKMLLRSTLALFIHAAESCVLSSWRKLRASEDLFSSLLNAIAQVAIARGGQLLHVLLIRLKPLVLAICAQVDTWGKVLDPMFGCLVKTVCNIIEYGWSKDRAPVDALIMGLVSYLRREIDYKEQDEKSKPVLPVLQLNTIRFLAELSISFNKWELDDMILPLFIESLEEGDASSPCQLRLRLLDAVSRMACLGFEKSYREIVVLMTRSYVSKLSLVGSLESKTLPPEATAERVEILPEGFLRVASGLKSVKLRADFRHRLLLLCSDVGLAAESKSGRSGADFLGPLLPAVAEICKDFDPTSDVEPSLLKLFRNLWFYMVLFGLAPPIQTKQTPTKSLSTSLNSLGSVSTVALQAVAGPYMWNSEWSLAVQQIAQGTPPFVVSSVKWLEDELELNALHAPGSRRGNANEKAAVAQRAALSAALGGRVDISTMSSISGVKATYLLAVTFLEITRFKCNGGILNGQDGVNSSISAFTCVFEYLKTADLLPAVLQCLTAMVYRAFETALEWLDDRVSEIGSGSDLWDSVLCLHACYLIKGLSQREEHIRNLSASFLGQLKERFPQILWNSSCINSLFSVRNDPSSILANDSAWVAMLRDLHQKIIRDWITNALSHAPCTTQGLLQEQLRKLSASQSSQHTTDVVSILSEVRLSTIRNDHWPRIRAANVPAVVGAAVAASGANLKATETFTLEVLSTSIASATLKSNHSGEIAGMKRLYTSIDGFQTGFLSKGFGPGHGFHNPKHGASVQQVVSEHEAFAEMLHGKFVYSLKQFVDLAERREMLDMSQFRETFSQATAFLLSNLDTQPGSSLGGFSQLLRLLCWCPAYILTPEAIETGIFVWTWLVSAAPQLGSLVLAELIDAWLWTIDTKRGLFAYDSQYAGPVAKLRPHLSPGEPEVFPDKDPVEAIIAHKLWLGFFIDRFEAVKYYSIEQLLLLGRMLQATLRSPSHFTRHPAAVGCFFTSMLLGLKFCRCQSDVISENCGATLQLLENRVYRASLCWFSHEPEWYNTGSKSFDQSEAQSVAVYLHHLIESQSDILLSSSSSIMPMARENSIISMEDQVHPVWGYMENYAIGLERRKQLLVMLCQHEADRLDVWANPTNCKDIAGSRPKISSDKWVDFAKTAFSVAPEIALCLASRFPTVSVLKAEVTNLVHLHIMELRSFPEAIPFFVTPKSVEENSVHLQLLPHWAACSITQAVEFLTPPYKGHPRVMAYVLRVLESYPPECVTFFMPQLVQALRYDGQKLVEGYLLGAALRSNIFAHSLIWHIQGESFPLEQGKEANIKSNSFQALLPIFRQQIVDSFSPEARDMFERVFDFWDRVTSISGLLYPLPKEERRAGIRRELEKIEVTGDDIYLPTAPNRLVRSIQLDSGIPLQSAAKVPIMITFNVVDRDGDPHDIKPQACIFKVGDDCRQDVLALQVISLLRDIFDAVGMDLYLFPYGVLPTGPERGIIEVVPNTRSRSQMGETTDGGLYEIFQQDYGPVGSSSFEAARDNFIISSAGYAVASLLLQPKDRHNGNLLFDNVGRLVHIDFGFIFEISPGGNLRFESAQFKLSHEMTQLLDPSGVMKSETWNRFVSLCVKGYLAARKYMDAIINTVLLMVDSGLPCFSRGDPVGNLRKRFHPEMTEREAANFMIHTCMDAYNKWSTAGYDLIQYIQQGIEK